MREKTNSQVTIIGAGPAGLTLALMLSKHKIPHVLIDKAIFPRDKICGDGFTLEVMRVLREIDENLYLEFISAEWTKASYGFYIEMKNGKNVNFDFKDKLDECGIYYTAKREDFDNWLNSKLNPEYTKTYFGWSAEKIEKNNNLIDVTIKNGDDILSINTKLLLGADGERSIVRKTFHPEGIKKNRAHHLGAIRCYYKGIPQIFKNSPLELYQLDSFNGYFWIFHLPNGEANVGLGGVSHEIALKNINLREELKSIINEHPKLKLRFKDAEMLETIKGWGIPTNSDAHQYVGDNYLLIGDSAKFAEPLTGKGIGVSMYAAFLAMPTIINAFEKNSYTKNDLISFENTIEKKYRKEWNLLYKWQGKANNEFLFSLLIRFINFPPIKKYISNKIANNFKIFISKPLKNKALNNSN